MADYYAVQRSDDFLAHYGVPGMKWGVRKAKPLNGSGQSRAFGKAQKKLAKLSNAQSKSNNYESSRYYEERPVKAKPKTRKQLRVEALEASRRADAALAERNRHLFGASEHSKYHKAYAEARRQASDAYSAYLNYKPTRRRRR